MKTEERFWSKVDKDGPLPAHRAALGPCWLWLAATSSGYGYFKAGGRQMRAHRFAYEIEVGPIPDGLVLDHLCRVKHCVNPSHLEPVTNRENLLRGETFAAENSAKTHCPYGHPFDGDNLYIASSGSRVCRECMRAANRRYYYRRPAHQYSRERAS